jgi:hypothetical protein
MNDFWSWNGWGAIAAIGQTLGAIATFIAVWATLQTAKIAKNISEESFKPKLKIMRDDFDETKKHDQLKFVVTNISSFPVQIRMVNLHFSINPSGYENMKTRFESPNSLLNTGESKKYSFEIKEIMQSNKDTESLFFFLNTEFCVELLSGERFFIHFHFLVRNDQIVIWDNANEFSKTFMIDLVEKSNKKLIVTKLNGIPEKED